MDERAPRTTTDEPPPFLGSWRNLYAGVIFILMLIIIAVYAFSRFFS
ncbi:MAG TPA: hypothetical protein VLT13_08655 [Bacteroidota bacterium]|nr:hypothetical protein [Bacteroidota bacterium]